MPTKGSKKAALAPQPELPMDEALAAAPAAATSTDLVPVSAEHGTVAVPQKSPKERAVMVLRADERKVELVALAAKSADIVEVNSVDGRAQVHRMAMDLKNTRCKIENEAEEARSDSTKFSRAVIEVERDLVALIKPEETRVFKLRDDFDEKVAAEKAEKERIEAERVNGIRTKIAAIRNLPSQQVGATSAELRAVLADLAAREITADEFSTFIGEAQMALDATGQELLGLLSLAITRENEEAARVKALAEEQARIAAQAEANRIETERLATLAREHELAEQERQRVAVAEQKERDRVATNARRQMEAQQAEIARARQQQDAEAAKTSMAMEQIRAIQHQLLVAEAGRAPYCKGGDIESFEFALKGTREWVVDEANFGGLSGIAQMAKDNVITKLEAGLAKLRSEAVADAARIAAMPPPVAVPAEVVAASVAAQEAASEPVCQLLVPVDQQQEDAAPELAGEATLDAFDKRSVDALKMAICDLLQTRSADEVRALVEAELVEFGKMGDA